MLAAVLVYDGRGFVPRCLDSVRRLAKGSSEVDVLVLDDCSPDAAWSRDLADLCNGLGIGYYRSPRNLGIPRNMNLALLRAIAGEYDYALILNSDITVPYNLVDSLIEVVDANSRIASVTPWSNNASIYSLPNDDPQQWLIEQEDTEWVSDALARAFRQTAVEIPVGVGFCLLIATSVVKEVGIFDPVYGRGYCEENDWCLRARARGFSNILAPGAFVYHTGGESTRAAGLVRPGQTTVVGNERILDSRFPAYRSDLVEFERSGVMSRLIAQGLSAVVVESAFSFGYILRLSKVDAPVIEQATVLVRPDPECHRVTARHRGFSAELAVDEEAGVIGSLAESIGRLPNRVDICADGSRAEALAREALDLGVPLGARLPYPEQV